MLETQWRVEAYAALSQLLKKPDPELLAFINEPGFQEVWQQVSGAYGVAFPQSWKSSSLPDLAEWKKSWNLTMGPLNAMAEPIESLYKVWTTDPSCENPIATQKGYLKGDWGWHMETLLKKSGIAIPVEFAHCPDHLILELEFFSMLAEQSTAAAQQVFAKHHLDWLEDLFHTAKDRKIPQLYQDLYEFAYLFVKADINSLS